MGAFDKQYSIQYFHLNMNNLIVSLLLLLIYSKQLVSSENETIRLQPAMKSFPDLPTVNVLENLSVSRTPINYASKTNKKKIQQIHLTGSNSANTELDVELNYKRQDYYLNSVKYPVHSTAKDDYFIPAVTNNHEHHVYSTQPIHSTNIDGDRDIRSRNRDIGARSGSRSDLYGVRESGVRHDITRGHEGYINMLHTKQKILRPHVALVHDENHLLSPNDGYSRDCSKDCKELQWQCKSNCNCIPANNRCDKVQHCNDGSDEYNCEIVGDVMSKLQKDCEQTGMHIMCPKTYRCINKDWLCDGDDDCGDFSDETHCGVRINCTENQFECSNGFCIPKQWLCDGDNDCRDFSDEGNCNRSSCTNEHFTCNDGFCVSIAFRCDGERDCNDNSDEYKCPAIMNSCPEGEFKCRAGLGGAGGPSGQCVLNRFLCDGDNDCGDWSDEENCPQKPSQCSSSEFKCADGSCIPKRWKCDKEQDCDGGEDENDCGSMDSSQHSTCASDEFTCNNGRCILRTWLCDGYPDCSSAEDEIECRLECDPGQFLCPAKKNFTNLKICVHQKHVCDGQNDCPLGEDEVNCPQYRSCESNTECEQLCIITPKGRKECACYLGYVMHKNKKSCVDIDECQYHSSPVCSQKCENTRGSFVCSCEAGYTLRPDMRSCKALGGAMTLIVANRWDIRRVTLSSNRYVAIVKGLHNAIAIDYHFRKGLLFWSDISTDVIKMVNMNGTRVRDVIKWGLEAPGGIAVDWVHDLLFWTDSGTRRVEVSNFQGSLRSVIVSNDLDKPRAIVVHPGEAVVFWTDWGPNPKIERAYMDGSQRQEIINKGVTWPNGLTIDYPNNKIYWADAKQHAIECSNFDGSDRVKILSTHLPHPFALTIFEDTMFWTDWNTKTVSAANKISGKGFRSVHENFHFPMDIHAYHSARQPEYYDRCLKDRRGLRGGCSHFCLPNKMSRRCDCPIGLSLKSDGKTCKTAPENVVLVARRKDIRLRQLNTDSDSHSIDMIIPLDNIKHAVAIDWSSDSDTIYWTDVEKSSINKAYLNGSHQHKVIHSNLVSPAGLALDWLTDKLYWTDPSTNRIEVATSNGRIRSLLIWENLDKPRDIVVNPVEGLMFWSDWGSQPMIERSHMDGQNRRVITSANLKWPNGLAIDYEYQKLYFVDGYIKSLEYMNFDGSGRRILLDGLGHPFGLDVSGNRVYWTDWDLKAALSTDKIKSTNITTIIANSTDLMDITVFHRYRKSIFHSCYNNNAGCSHLCLLNPTTYTCGCPVGITIKADNHTCASGPSKYIIVAHRIDIRQISLDFDHLIDVVLPLPPISNAIALDVDINTGNIYWSDTMEDIIMSSSADGLNTKRIIYDSLHNPDGLIIDSIGRMIYWTDAGRHTVEVATLEGKYRHLIAWRDLESPRGLALDYEAGFLFWTDWGHYRKIERANMDGGNRIRIITSNLGWPNGLSLDLKLKRVYWVDAQLKTIDSCDYSGNRRKLIASSLNHPYALTLTDDYIYWTDWKSKALHMANRHNISERRDVMTNIDGLMDIKYIETNTILTENVCGRNNGGCSQLCLRHPSGFSCKCGIGLQLKKNSTTNCEHMPKDYLIIALRSGVGMIALNTDALMDVVLPIQNVHGVVVLDFHYHKNWLFIADVNLDIIRRINLSNLSQSDVVIKTNLATPNGIAVDWLADNLYWSDSDHRMIEVSRLNGSCRRGIITDELGDPRSLIIHPKKGYLFWSDWDTPSRIERSFLDGSNRSIIIGNNLGFPTGLTIDFESRRLLWADALEDNIGQADFSGKHRTVVIQYATHPFGLTIFDGSIYWTDWYNKSVFRAYRKGRSFSKPVEIRSALSGALDIRSVSLKRQPLEPNQCTVDNGGCTHLCLLRATDYVCACPDKPDKKHCSTIPKFYIPPQRLDDSGSDYTDDFMDFNNLPTDKDDFNYNYHVKNSSQRETLILIAIAIVIMLLLIIVSAIIYLISSTKQSKSTKRQPRDSTKSVLTFSNPNYSVDGQTIEPKTTIWKRFKTDRSNEHVYEERNLHVEKLNSNTFKTASSSQNSSFTKELQPYTLPTIT